MEAATRYEWSITSNGTSEVKRIYPSNPMQCGFYGTFGGASIVLESSMDGIHWDSVDDVAITQAKRIGLIFASRGEYFRVVTTGATSPDIVVLMQEVQQ